MVTLAKCEPKCDRTGNLSQEPLVEIVLHDALRFHVNSILVEPPSTVFLSDAFYMPKKLRCLDGQCERILLKVARSMWWQVPTVFHSGR